MFRCDEKFGRVWWSAFRCCKQPCQQLTLAVGSRNPQDRTGQDSRNPSSPPSPARRRRLIAVPCLACFLPAPHPPLTFSSGAAWVHRQQPTPSVNFLPLLPNLTPSSNPPVLVPKRSTPALRRNSTFSSHPRRSRPPSGVEIHPTFYWFRLLLVRKP